MNAVVRLAATLGGLRPVQWLYLPLRRLQDRLPAFVAAPDIQLRQSPPAPAAQRVGINDPPGAGERAAAIVRREFTFLGESRKLPSIDWQQRYVNHLWSYNLHYFDYARDLAWVGQKTGDAIYAQTFTDLALSWIKGTRKGRGDGWSPYPTSLRIVNWLYALALFSDSIPRDKRKAIAASLAMQGRWLERRIERHLQANHLQKNFYALAVAGLSFDGPAAERWRAMGLEGSWRAVRDQVLEDGGHYERSPMYHCIALQDFLELAALARAAGVGIPQDVVERLGRMVAALAVLCRPDGKPHLFNDAAEGIAPQREYLERLAGEALPAPDQWTGIHLELPRTGYFAYQEDSERLVVDCGPPGPRHQPGHAHCDLLSFELDLAGRPFAVDSGVHGYAGDRFREYVRSTRAHNTVMIGGREQHELWGTFRMGRAGRALDAAHEVGFDGYCFSGACSPYHDRCITHRRTIRRSQRHWRVTDRVTGADGQRLESFLHLHPSWDLVPQGHDWLAVWEGAEVEIVVFGADRAHAASGIIDPPQGWYCPRFGTAVPAPVLQLEVDQSDGRDFGYTLRPRSERP